MAVIQCIPTSCKQELLTGVHDFSTDEMKIALYGSAASLGPDTTAYTTSGEIAGVGYVAGGVTLQGQLVMASNGSAWVQWENPSWPGGAFFASAAMIYNADKANRAVLILNFGMSRPFSGTTNFLQLPPSTAETALMRLT